MSLKGVRTPALWRATTLWIAALGFLAGAAQVATAEAQLNRVSKTVLEIRGGTGPKSWTIRYGTYGEVGAKAQLVAGTGEHAWFSHGSWLRLIDTDKGVVLGRWHFPEQILKVNPVDSKVQVEIEIATPGEPLHQTLIFDPASGTPPPVWPSVNLMLSRVPKDEVLVWNLKKDQGLLATTKISDDQEGRKLLPSLEEAIVRDPVSPWLRVARARLLRALGDARAAKAFEEALQIPAIDFRELLPISAFLEQIGEREPAHTAFERGYASFLEHGNDPRLLRFLVSKLILYHPWKPGSVDLADPYNREIMERTYRVGPRSEGADVAWAAYADYLEMNGGAQEARRWRARAEEAAESAILSLPRRAFLLADLLLLLVIASLIAGALYFGFLWLRYRPQRRADAAVYQTRIALARAVSWFNFQYWTRSQRLAFLTIVLVGWVAVGCLVVPLSRIQRAAASPDGLSSGSLAGPATVDYLESQQPHSPEQKLLLAIAYHQSGSLDKAESLYRNLPEFAESWNNLGVLQKAAGKGQEARQSFERALRLDPRLHEAALNLGQPPRDLWTELHQHYLPSRPILAPPREGRMARVFLRYPLGRFLVYGGVGGPVFGLYTGYGSFFAFSPLTGGTQTMLDPLSRGVSYLLIAAMALALVLVFLRPRATAPKTGTLWTVVEILFPGVSPAWNLVGGVALVAWMELLLADFLTAVYSTPYVFSSIGSSTLEGAYRVPGASNLIVQQLRPGPAWVYLAPAALLVVNALLVIRARRVTRTS